MTGIGLFTTFAPVSDRAQPATFTTGREPATFNRAGASDIL